MRLLVAVAHAALFLSASVAASASERNLLRRPLTAASIAAVELIKAQTNQAIGNLTNGLVIALDEIGLSAPSFNLRAVTTGSIHSVVFAQPSQTFVHTERVAPFAYCGNAGPLYKQCPTLGLGTHTVRITTYTKRRLRRRKGATLEISFSIVATRTSPNVPTALSPMAPWSTPTLPVSAPSRPVVPEVPVTASVPTVPTAPAPRVPVAFSPSWPAPVATGPTSNPVPTVIRTPVSIDAPAIVNLPMALQPQPPVSTDVTRTNAPSSFTAPSQTLTKAPSLALTTAPATPVPSLALTTAVPIPAPTKVPSQTLTTAVPIPAPTLVAAPTRVVTKAPANGPTKSPLPPVPPPKTPTKAPATSAPVQPPTKPPTKAPTKRPTKAPTDSPTKTPTKAPTKTPTKAPTQTPTKAPTPGVWIDSDTPIIRRYQGCFVMVDNAVVGRRAYLVGGIGDNVDSDVYNPFTKAWSKAPRPPIALSHMTCVAAQGKLWIMAAWTGTNQWETNPEYVYVFDPATNAWGTKTALPLARRRGSAAVIVSPDQTKIYVSHGTTGGHEKPSGNYSVSLPFLDVYDIATDSWTALSSSAPNVRDHAGGAMIGTTLLCMAGGRHGGANNWPNVAPTDCYNLTSGVWTVKDPIPQVRSRAQYLTTCDGKLMVLGGETGGKVYNNIDIFDGTKWTKRNPLPVGRHSAGLALDCACNQMHLVSGMTVPNGSPDTSAMATYHGSGAVSICTAN